MVTEADLDELRKRLRAKRDATVAAAIAAADVELEAKLQSIASVAELLRDDEPVVVSEAVLPPPTKLSIGPAEAVRDACKMIPSPFGMPDIYAYLRKKFNGEVFDKTAISGVLNKFRHRKEILTVREAFGRTPALYELPKSKEGSTPADINNAA